ncbi:MAG: ABC transporter ATP-binding protein [Tissierellia bacterium]|nr:ABC transporter ATP-binding protein [Tissierellia bacterium]
MKSIKIAFELIKEASRKNKKFLLMLLANGLFVSLKSLAFLKLIESFTSYLTSKEALSPLIFAFVFYSLFRLMEEYLLTKLIKVGNEFIYLVEKELLRKSLTIPYEEIEDPAFFDLQQQAKFSLRNQYALENMIEALIGSVEAVATVLVTAFVFAALSFEMGLVLLLIIFLNLGLRVFFSKKDDDFYKKLGPINTWIWFYQYLPFEKERLLDIKANSMEKNILQRYEKYIQQTNRLFQSYYQRMGLQEGISDLLNTLIFFLLFLRGIYGFYQGEFQLSHLSMILIGSIKMIEAFALIGEHAVDFWRYSMFSKPVVDFLKLEEEKEKKGEKFSEKKAIVAENLSFGYGEKEVLKNINFSLDKNKLIVLIGENGSGKSTLMKLIAGLYSPDEGTIQYGGVNTRDLAYSHMSPVFQKFTLLKDFTAYENMSGSTDTNRKKVEDLLSTLAWERTFCFDRPLGSEIDESYIDLSKGQEQQTATLRALYQDRDLFILDEPSSAMDIEKERELYNTLVSLKDKKKVFLVSHRLTAVHQADEIWLIKKGELFQYGSHEEAIKSSKTYRDLYHHYYASYENIS